MLEESVFQQNERRKRPNAPLLLGKEFGKTRSAKFVYSITVIVWLLFPAVTYNSSVNAWLSDLANARKVDVPQLPPWEYAYIVVAIVIVFLTAVSATANLTSNLATNPNAGRKLKTFSKTILFERDAPEGSRHLKPAKTSLKTLS